MSVQHVHVLHIEPPASPTPASSDSTADSASYTSNSASSHSPRSLHRHTLSVTVPSTPAAAHSHAHSAVLSIMSSSPSSSSGGYKAGSGLAQVSALAANQLLTRGLTFAMNLYVARAVGPVAFGLQAIHLYLLNTIILFIAREPNRKSTHSQPAVPGSAHRPPAEQPPATRSTLH